jgi:hypothetical protein
MRQAKKLLLLLLVSCYTGTVYSQNTYLVGTSQVSIEPGNDLVSLSLGGYAAPWEGRFTLQWIRKDPVSETIALTGAGDKLYMVSDHNLCYADPSENILQWQKVGNADQIIALAGSANKLFAVTQRGELSVCELKRKVSKWEKIGFSKGAASALAVSGKQLYVANKDGSLWVADSSGRELEWSKIEPLNLKNIVSMTANDRNLFALTNDGVIFRCEVLKPDRKWIKIAYRNGISVKENIRHIAIAARRLYGVGDDNMLYESEHRTDGDLSARAIAIKDGNMTAVIVSVDLVGLNDKFIGLVKEEIAKTKGIPSSALFLNISHTHFAPVTQCWQTWQEHNQSPDSIYLYSTVKNGILTAVSEAMENMRPATLSFGRGKTNIGYNRSLDDHPDLYDDDVDVIKVKYVGEDRESYLFMAACHPVFSTSGKLHYTVSANYPGVARNLIEKRTGTSHSMFLQGTAGDINPRDNGEYITGEKLANEVIAVLDRPMNSVSGPISFFLDTINIPVSVKTRDEILAFKLKNSNKPGDIEAERNLNWCDLMLKHYDQNDMPTSLPVYVQTINLGNWKLIGFSRETTSEYSVRAKEFWPGQMVSVAGYTNDVSSYLPTQMHIRKQNYEGLGSFFWYGMPNTFPTTVDHTIFSFIKSQNR